MAECDHPWWTVSRGTDIRKICGLCGTDVLAVLERVTKERDESIAAASQAVARLMVTVEALEWYANCDPTSRTDIGRRAREALVIVRGQQRVTIHGAETSGVDLQETISSITSDSAIEMTPVITEDEIRDLSGHVVPFVEALRIWSGDDDLELAWQNHVRSEASEGFPPHWIDPNSPKHGMNTKVVIQETGVDNHIGRASTPECTCAAVLNRWGAEYDPECPQHGRENDRN